MSRSHDGDVPETAFTQVLAVPFAHCRCHMLIERPAFALQILELTGARVARAHQYEKPSCRYSGPLDKGFDGVAAEVRIHGEHIGVPNGKGGFRIGRGRGGNVAALAVENSDKPHFFSAPQDRMLGREAGWPSLKNALCGLTAGTHSPTKSRTLRPNSAKARALPSNVSSYFFRQSDGKRLPGRIDAHAKRIALLSDEPANLSENEVMR